MKAKHSKELELSDLQGQLDDMARNRKLADDRCAKLEVKCKELETKLDLEKTTKGRMESHISRQTDVIESLQKDLEELAVKEKRGQDEQKKLAASVR